MSNDAGEDAAGHALETYYSLPERERPVTRDDFMLFVHNTAEKYINKTVRNLAREGAMGSKFGDDDVMEAWERAEWLSYGFRPTRPNQEIYIDAKRALEITKSLPPTMRRMAEKMADGANVAEAAKELDLDIIEAMRAQKAMRTLTRWMADDEQDEKMRNAEVGTLSDHPHRRAEERHGVAVDQIEFVEMTRKIKAGAAILIEDRGPTDHLYIVPFRDATLPVAYNPLRNIIVSVLPKNSAQELAYRERCQLAARAA